MEKNDATETYGIRQTACGASCMNRASVFEWHKKFEEGRESMRDDERCGRSWLAKGLGLGYHVEVLREFRKRFHRKRPAVFKLGQWHFHQDNAPVHNPMLVTNYLSKMGIKTVPQPPYSPDLVPCDFWLFPKLRGDERGFDKGHWHAHARSLPWGLPEVVGTVQVHCSRGRLLRRGLEFHVCTINKSAHTKKSGNLFNDPRIFLKMSEFVVAQ